MTKVTFKDWWKATKNHSHSPLGAIQTNLIITFFVFTGCFLGALQNKYFFAGPSYVSFLLFSFGALNGYNFYLMLKQYKIVKQQIETMKFIKKTQEQKTE